LNRLPLPWLVVTEFSPLIGSSRRRAGGADRDDQSGVRSTREPGVELAPVDVRDASGTPERGRRGPNGAELSDPGRIGGIPKDSRSRHPRRDLFGRSFESRSRKLKIHCREKRTSGLTVLSD